MPSVDSTSLNLNQVFQLGRNHNVQIYMFTGLLLDCPRKFFKLKFLFRSLGFETISSPILGPKRNFGGFGRKLHRLHLARVAERPEKNFGRFSEKVSAPNVGSQPLKVSETTFQVFLLRWIVARRPTLGQIQWNRSDKFFGFFLPPISCTLY